MILLDIFVIIDPNDVGCNLVGDSVIQPRQHKGFTLLPSKIQGIFISGFRDGIANKFQSGHLQSHGLGLLVLI